MMRHRHTMALAALLLWGCTGCLLAVSGSSTNSGITVPTYVLSGINRGVTSREWLVNQVGPPTSESTRPDGVEVLEYTSTTTKSARVDIFILLDLDTEEQRSKTVFFEVQDGIIVDYYVRSVKEKSRIDF